MWNKGRRDNWKPGGKERLDVNQGTGGGNTGLVGQEAGDAWGNWEWLVNGTVTGLRSLEG